MNDKVSGYEKKVVSVLLSEDELRYILGAGFGLLQNVPADSLPTYVNFSKDEILQFSKKIRRIMDDNGISV